MLTRGILTLTFVGFLFMVLPMSATAEIMHWPTEVTYYNSATAYNGVTVFAPQQQTASNSYIYAIDMYGRLVHKVLCPLAVSPYASLLEDGNFLTQGQYPAGNAGGYPTSNHYVAEVSWEGKVVNQFTVNGVHHDYKKYWNKFLNEYTYICVFTSMNFTAAQAAAWGANPNNGTIVAGSLDGIVEYDKNGNIVWQWSTADHLCQSYSPSYPNHVSDVADAPGRLDVNVHWVGQGTSFAIWTVPGSDWTHFNSCDYNPDTGYVVMNSRNMNEFWVVDHDHTFVSTTNFAANIAAAASTSGDFLYRFGCPSNYNQGGLPAWGDNVSTQLWGEHNIQWIPDTMWTGGPALPGAGHFLVFDNHQSNNNPLGGYSRMAEINPYVTGPAVSNVYPTSSAYVNPPSAGYTRQSGSSGNGFAPENVSNQIVWNFKPAMGNSLLSSHISGVQRMPNGNTLACSGEQGHFLEVTSSGQMAWEYSSPIDGTTSAVYKYQVNSSSGSNYQVFRAYRYSVLYPGINSYVRQLPNGQILPISITDLQQMGVGQTLTGQAPCTNVPCANGTVTANFPGLGF